MAKQDLREFLARLDEAGELKTVKTEVDWNLEAAAVVRRLNETGGPAALFEKLKGYPKGFRIVGGHTASLRRLAMMFGLKRDASYSEVLNTYIERRSNPIKPITVSTGPCKENIMKGDDVDLFRFPTPMIHEGDGGRYLGTLYAGACKDLDSNWVNWGTYRVMIHDKNHTGIFISPVNHGGMILKKYERANRPMQYACFIGVDPLINQVATSGVPYGETEVDVAGGLFGEPLELVKAETVDLMVPARAEIVLEGEILPNERRDEGPFGEYPGYVVSGVVPRPVFKVNAITYRNDPIITMVALGTPVDDGHAQGGLSLNADIKIDLLRAGIPITEVYVPPECACGMAVVGVHNVYHGIPQRAANCIWTNRNGQVIPHVIVVDDDVDPTNMNEVMHALSVKCNPATGIHLQPGASNCSLTPYLPAATREIGKGGGNVLYDCTWPLDWPKQDIPRKGAFKTIFPKEMQEKVLSRWKEYGLN